MHKECNTGEMKYQYHCILIVIFFFSFHQNKTSFNLQNTYDIPHNKSDSHTFGHIHRVGHRIPNLLSSLFGLSSFATFTFYKVWFLGVPFRIYSIDIVDFTHYSVVLSVTGTRFL